jgi:hypothetical protein
MQAYKVKGRIDDAGKLIITEAIDLQPGEVEIIVLQSSNTLEFSSNSTQTPIHCKTNAFRELLAIAQPVPPDFDLDQACWEALNQ